MDIHQPRYDPEKKIYRDCRFCKGRGCVACEGEAEKDYQAQFPGGPEPILTISRKELPGAMKILKPIIGPEGMMAAKKEGLRRAKKKLKEHPGLAESMGMTHDQAAQAIAVGMAGEIVHEKIFALRDKLRKPKKAGRAGK